MRKILTILLSAGISLSAHAIPCFLTMVKDSCWTNYNLSVKVTDASTGKQITTVTVPQGKSWAREEFDCRPAETLSLVATFAPVFWADDEGKTYAAQHNWKLPETVTKGDTAWNITMCYPKEFSEVPLPPEASGNCQCITDNIPPVKPQ